VDLSIQIFKGPKSILIPNKKESPQLMTRLWMPSQCFLRYYKAFAIGRLFAVSLLKVNVGGCCGRRVFGHDKRADFELLDKAKLA
jgi:hypothetical protein